MNTETINNDRESSALGSDKPTEALSELQLSHIVRFTGYCNGLSIELWGDKQVVFLSSAQHTLEQVLPPLPGFRENLLHADELIDILLDAAPWEIKELLQKSHKDSDYAATAFEYCGEYGKTSARVILDTAFTTYLTELDEDAAAAIRSSDDGKAPTWLTDVAMNASEFSTASPLLKHLYRSLSTLRRAVDKNSTIGPGATRRKVLKHLIGYKPYQPEA